MQHLLADVTFRSVKGGAAFTWEGVWEFDRLQGTGQLRLTKAGRLRGVIQIAGGDQSDFAAERTAAPVEPIQEVPLDRYKWGRRYRL